MDYLSEHRKILEQAASEGLPDRVNEEGGISVEVVKDLYENGYLAAADACSMDGMEYLNPRITISGREYLNALNERAFEGSTKGKVRKIGLRIIDWSLGVAAGLIIAWAASYLG